MIAYLAGPIDFNKGSKVAKMRREITAKLHKDGYWVFDPSQAWSMPNDDRAEIDGKIQTANYAVIDQCNLLVAILLKDVFTIGTILEIGYARRQNGFRDVVVIGDIGHNSIALDELEVTVYESVEEAWF